jgi:ribosomal protein S18 acetylase RimI-like enzyme
MNAVTLRPMLPADMPFLLRVYASTRADELAAVPWTPEQKAEFITSQFNAQHSHYQTHYSDAQYLVILLEGEPVGRIYIHRRSKEIEVIDIALLPEYRRRGIGSALLRQVAQEADETRRDTTLYVEQNNPAFELYSRLGFVREDEHGVYFFMRRLPVVQGETR